SRSDPSAWRECRPPLHRSSAWSHQSSVRAEQMGVGSIRSSYSFPVSRCCVYWLGYHRPRPETSSPGAGRLWESSLDCSGELPVGGSLADCCVGCVRGALVGVIRVEACDLKRAAEQLCVT